MLQQINCKFFRNKIGVFYICGIAEKMPFEYHLYFGRNCNHRNSRRNVAPRLERSS